MHYLLVLPALLLALPAAPGAAGAEEAEHRDFQHIRAPDPLTGRYDFAYDTGLDNDIAHAMHMQYRDADGVVRGRYGYTDPRGKLRMVEYEAGPGGFVARGDVGPDEFPHDQTPAVAPSQLPRQQGLYQYDDREALPRPVQMAGWDPVADPMGRETNGAVQDDEMGTTTNATGGAEVSVSSGVLAYDERYPRIFVNENSPGRESEDLKEETNPAEEYPVAGPLNVNSIDVSPNEIRSTPDSKDTPDGDVSSPRTSRELPYSYRNYRPSSETRTQATGYRVVYRPDHDHYHERHYGRIPNHDHDAERRYYYVGNRRYVVNRNTHDHDAERRYVANRYTHDHDAERRYVANRYTHDHDAEKRYVANRYTHDHDAERRYYVGNRNRQTHDHDAEGRYYYTRDGYYYGGRYYPSRRRVFYRDSHSMVPHEHYSDVYRNDNDRYHQHSDRQLYGRSQNLEVPATAKPRQLVYVPSDKYHDKYYYWSS